MQRERSSSIIRIDYQFYDWVFSNIKSILFLLVGVLFFVLMFFSIEMSRQNNLIEEYHFLKETINVADSSDGIKKFKILTRAYDEETCGYYIVFDNGNNATLETRHIYSLEQVMKYEVNESISVVLINSNIRSVDDYVWVEFANLTQDDYLESNFHFPWMAIFVMTYIVVCIIVSILLIIWVNNKSKKAKGKMISGRAIRCLTIFAVLFYTSTFLCLTGNAVDDLQNTHTENIEDKYAFYQAIIEEGYNKKNIVDVKALSYRYNKKWDGYSIVYQLMDTQYSGETFATYSLDEAKNILEQGYIEIAIDSLTPNYFTKSIDTNFKNVSLEDIREYEYVFYQSHTVSSLVLLSSICILVSFVSGAVMLYVVINIDKFSYSIGIDAARYKVCPYCGSKVRANKQNCSKCGAGI